MVMIKLGWNDFPDNIRKNLVKHYLERIKRDGQGQPVNSIMDMISQDHEVNITVEMTEDTVPHTVSVLSFSEEKYAWFVLKWS